MFDTLAEKVPQDKDLPVRAWRLAVMRRVLQGTLYDVLKQQFHDERNGSGEYVPLRQRKPSVRYNLCRIVVRDTVSMLFGDGHFPAIECGNPDQRTQLTALLADAKLASVMSDAAYRGSVGSIAVRMRVLESRLFFDAMDTDYLTPAYKADAPDTLEKVVERYKVLGRELAARGYTIPDEHLDAAWWFQREWTDSAENWYMPKRVNDEDKTPPALDEQNTVYHGLGFVPLVWIKNMPGGDGIDGECTFRPAVETSIEIDYQLSQAGRGLKYSSDPLLMIREPAGAEGEMIRSAGNALVVSEKGDAKLLEIDGTASSAVIEYVRFLREVALESIQGNRSSADKLAAAQSGRALQMLHQSLIWLTDDLRTSYGDNGVLKLARMVAAAAQIFPLKTADGVARKIAPNLPISLRWPAWFHPTELDKREQASTLSDLRESGHISRRTAVSVLADSYGIDAVDDELARIIEDEVAADARDAARAAQTKAVETPPG